MATALICYATNANASSPTGGTAGLVVNGTGASGNHNNTTLLGTATGYGEVPSQGTGSAWPALGSLAAVPVSGNGWLFDTTLLEQQQIPAGTWTAVIQTDQSVQTSASSIDFYVRAYKLANDGATYTSIGNMTLTGQTTNVTTAATQYTLIGSLSAMSFALGDKLYFDVVYNVTANNTGSGAATIKFFNSNSLTQGRANQMQVTTPGYNPIVAVNVTITNAGLNLIRDSLKGSNNPLISYVALGTGNTAPSTSDTALAAEVFRVAVSSYANGANPGEILITGYIQASQAVGFTIAEIGFFGGSTASITTNSGVLLARGLYSLSSKTSLESLQAVLDFTL